MTSRLQTVHVRVNDAGTGKPTPVRIRIADAEGNHYLPLGFSPFFATGPNQDVGGRVLIGMKPYAYIDGACEIALPAGPLQVQISKGPEFVPQNIDTTLTAGKLSMRFAVERWIDLRQDGWYSGDTRCHFLTPHAALLEGQAEDVAVVNLLATECEVTGPFRKTFPAAPNLLAFSGQTPCLEAPGHLVVVNTHNRHPQLGSLGLLHCHRVVHPLTIGTEEHAGWTLAAWCDQCHRKRGLVVWTHTTHESSNFAYGEPLADLILGKVDAFEITFYEDSPFDVLPLWYTLLNAGLSVPLVGASGKESNGVALGAMRTYAQLQPGQPLDYRAWIDAVRAGRTFVTNGPLLRMTVDGQAPGATLSSNDRSTVHVVADARSQVPFGELEIVVDGKVVASAQGAGEPCAAALELDLPVPEGGWLAARCRGDQQILQQPANQRVFAHTSPVWLRRPGPVRRDAAAVAELRKELEAMLTWARTQHAGLVAVFEGALARISQ